MRVLSFSCRGSLASFSWDVFAALENQGGYGEIIPHAITVAHQSHDAC
jgi:hypothetical protein